jgi:hypothetical protein
VSVLVETLGEVTSIEEKSFSYRLIEIGETAMSAIIKFVTPTDLLFQPGHEKSAAATQKEKSTEPRTVGEPERRFWKPLARRTSQTFATIELFFLVGFLILALAEILGCFAELYHLLDSDAVKHVAAKAINGGA